MIPLTKLNGEHVPPGPSNLIDAMSTPDQGALTSAAQGLANQVPSVNPHITFEQLLAQAKKTSLEQEFSRLEEALGTITSQSSALESALSGLS
jgi:hypothetical protein